MNRSGSFVALVIRVFYSGIELLDALGASGASGQEKLRRCPEGSRPGIESNAKGMAGGRGSRREIDTHLLLSRASRIRMGCWALDAVVVGGCR